MRLCTIVLLLSGCIGVHAVKATNGDLSRHHTFAFYPADDSDYEAFVRSPAGTAIRARVASALERRGLVLDEARPDLWVAFYLVVEQEESAPYASPLGPLYWAAPGSIQYLRGTVVLDLIDPATRDVVWRGTARTLVTHPENPDPRKMTAAVDKLMRRL